MTSHKRRTTSKSGNSGKSRKTDTWSPSGSSSKTAPASFAQVFGEQEPKELQRLRELKSAAIERLKTWEALPEPKLALYRTRHRQRGGALRRHIATLQEAIEAAKTTTD